MLDTSTQSTPSILQASSQALAGKIFPSNYIYTIAASSITQSNNAFSGSVAAGYEYSNEPRSFNIVDAQKGIVEIDGENYKIMGSSIDGNNIVLGSITVTNYSEYFSYESYSPAILVANSGEFPTDSVSFNSYYTYNSPNIPCFLRGTKILTASGYINVEALTSRDVLIDDKGNRSKIVWIGSTSVSLKNSPWQKDLSPVQISQGAFGLDCPSSDLFLSPGHGIVFNLLGNKTIPVSALVNNKTIRTSLRDEAEYWHIELENHGVILAQGLACESYVDHGNRNVFGTQKPLALLATQSAAELLDGKSAVKASEMARHSDGPLVTAIRQQIEERCGEMGWSIERHSSEITMKADAAVLERPIRQQDSIRFLVPADTETLTLKSETFMPAHFDAASTDTRSLGLRVRAIHFIDGSCFSRTIQANELTERQGFHEVEPDEVGATRWSKGEFTLTKDLWSGTEGDFFVRVDYASDEIPMWTSTANEMTADVKAA